MGIVELSNKEIFNLLENHNNLDRKLFTMHYGWNYPTKKSLNVIIKHTKDKSILEIGSGLGLWTRLLFNSGINITAVDNLSWKNNNYKFHEPIKIDALDAVKKYKTNVLLMSYPEIGGFCNSIMSYFKGDILVYIGEVDSGMSCDDNFFEMLNKEWKVLEKVDIEHWDGIHDEVIIYRRI